MNHPKLIPGTRYPMIYVSVLLHWEWRTLSGIAKYEAIAMIGEESGKWELSDYQWFEGNDSCDCNRSNYIGLTPESAPDLFGRWATSTIMALPLNQRLSLGHVADMKLS